MAKLMYITNVSLDGYIEDASGAFDFSEPDDEVFAFITDLIKPIGTFVYGRKLYETMAVWETEPSFAQESELYAAFADAWQDCDKVVVSTTRTEPLTARTRIVDAFDPDEIRRLKAEATQDLCIGGAEITQHAWSAGLIDECHLFISPALLGGGKPALPQGVRSELELLDSRRFRDAVYVRYAVSPPRPD